MDVNDAELLALAGDTSSDEGHTPAPPATTKKASPLPPTDTSHAMIRDSSVGMSNSTPNPSAKAEGVKRTKKPMRKADSEEEGEA